MQVYKSNGHKPNNQLDMFLWHCSNACLPSGFIDLDANSDYDKADKANKASAGPLEISDSDSAESPAPEWHASDSDVPAESALARSGGANVKGNGRSFCGPNSGQGLDHVQAHERTSQWNFSTVWAGNIPVVQRMDQGVRISASVMVCVCHMSAVSHMII